MSVIVPVFDRVDYLAEAVRSVDLQTVRPAELIVVVDGPSVDVDDALAATTIPVTVLSRPRGGPGAARNTGCATAVGSLFAFIDQDDLWLPTKLARQTEILRTDPTRGAVFAGVEQFFSPELQRSGVPLRVPDAERSGLLPSSMVVRASTFARVGGFREGTIFGELMDWLARALDLGTAIATVDETLVRRRVHDHNAGVRYRSARSEYAVVMKDILDRRRAG